MVNKETNKVWKFFKPSILKAVIAAVIFFFFVPLVSIDSGVRCVTEPCDSESTVSLLIYFISVFEGVTVYDFFYSNILLGIIASYVLACLVLVIVIYLKNKAKDI
ncbi:hypothetical protein A3K73_07175 [Candidatus Pacearchaeota archaeon RBG_13_36_9]|nr:MAG: hypothetical protein A3K73_07175 [Candidatus Pacearchaeota archaeon RBG_13_36_9]